MKGRPILARIGSLHLGVHLHRMLGRIIVLDHVNRLFPVDALENIVDVGGEQEVAIDEDRPSVMGSEVRRQEPRERKLGRSIVGRAPVKTEFPQGALLQRIDFEITTGVAHERMAAHLPCDVLAAVVAHVYFQRVLHGVGRPSMFERRILTMVQRGEAVV